MHGSRPGACERKRLACSDRPGGDVVGSGGDEAGSKGCGRVRMTLSAVRKCLAVNHQPVRSTWRFSAGEQGVQGCVSG